MAAFISGTAVQVEAATQVEEVVSESGVRAYLVHDPSVPFLSMAFQFRAGSVYDPDGKPGLANMLSGLLDEGAGPYDSQAFHTELEDNAIRLSFSADRDSFSGSLKTLNETREHAFELLRLALQEPRLDPEPVERIRSQIIADLRRRESNPNYVASRAWFEQAFSGHPYGRPTRGTIESVERIETAELRRFLEAHLGRDTLAIGVAGDVTAEELKRLLDHAFAGLPATASLPAVAPAEPVVGATIVVPMAVPQSVVTFGHGGIARQDPDYYAAYIANYILGGGGFSSRLMQEVRESRGLAYSVQSYLYDTELAPLWLGGVATRNDLVAQSIELVRAETEKMARGEVSEADLQNAKTYLTGSFALRLTNNDQIAQMLLGMIVHDLGIDYLDRRNAYMEAVTLDELRRVADRLLGGPMLVTVVGTPVGLGG
jgi:zinc protease